MDIKLLNSPESFRQKLRSCIQNSAEIYCAVAWATENPISNDLVASNEKIKKLVIGIHFYQTDPRLLEKLRECPNLRIGSTETNGVFHPKIYLFFNGKKATAFVGSANFTNGALTANDEAIICLTGAKDESIFSELQKAIETYWKAGCQVDDDLLSAYKRKHDSMQQNKNALAKTFKIIRPNMNAPNKDLLSLSWREFSTKVRQEKHHDFQERLRLLKESRRLFIMYGEFSDMPESIRKALSGVLRGELPHILSEPNNIIDWGWFGSMIGAGVFRNRVIENDGNISLALDCIPSLGEITRDSYDAYIEQFVRAFDGQERGAGVPTASRLLTIKRPDFFVCVNSKNRDGLCHDLGMPPSTLNFEKYWTQIIEPITEATWWKSQRPNGEDGLVWDYRSAMLDAIYYDPNN